jgi:hypothetical protein
VDRIAKPDQLREFQIERPDLHRQALLGDLPPEVALDRHQAGLFRLSLQPLPGFGVIAAVCIRSPGNGQVNSWTWLALRIEDREVEVSEQLSARFEFDAGQLERSRVVTRSQHPSRLPPERAPG